MGKKESGVSGNKSQAAQLKGLVRQASVSVVVGAALLLGFIIFNRRNWQSYLSFQLAMVVFSIVPVLLSVLGLVTAPMLSYVAAAMAVFSFLGTVIIGGRRATTELKRRFHI